MSQQRTISDASNFEAFVAKQMCREDFYDHAIVVNTLILSVAGSLITTVLFSSQLFCAFSLACHIIAIFSLIMCSVNLLGFAGAAVAQFGRVDRRVATQEGMRSVLLRKKDEFIPRLYAAFLYLVYVVACGVFLKWAG